MEKAVWHMNEAEWRQCVAKHNEAAALRYAAEVERAKWQDIISQQDAKLKQIDVELAEKGALIAQLQTQLLQPFH